MESSHFSLLSHLDRVENAEWGSDQAMDAIALAMREIIEVAMPHLQERFAHHDTFEEWNKLNDVQHAKVKAKWMADILDFLEKALVRPNAYVPAGSALPEVMTPLSLAIRMLREEKSKDLEFLQLKAFVVANAMKLKASQKYESWRADMKDLSWPISKIDKWKKEAELGPFAEFSRLDVESDTHARANLKALRKKYDVLSPGKRIFPR